MHNGCCRDHGVFAQSVRPSVHEPCPLREGGCVHRQYAVGSEYRSGLRISESLGGLALALVVMVWFSMGAEVNPLIRVYPFSGLDTARFQLYMAPLMALVAAALAERLMSLARELPLSLSPAYGPPCP